MNPAVLTPSSMVTPEAPWLGLRAFTEDLRAYFFGRQREVGELFDRVAQRPLTVLFGQSGLGKTSLVQAALLPRLREAGFVPVILRLDHEDDAPPLEAQVLTALHGCLGATLQPGATELDLWQLLHDPAAGVCRIGAPRPILILDQFEEIFTLGETTRTRRDRSEAFLRMLADVIENRVPEPIRQQIEEDLDLGDRLDFAARPLRILLALRDDFLHRLERWRPWMPSLMDNRFELRLLTGPQALEAVLEPGRLRCRATPGKPPLVEPAVGEAIVRFVAGADPQVPMAEIDAVPPLLSLLCAELNAARGESSVIRPDQLAGRAEDILAQFYARCLAGHPPALAEFLEERLLSPEGFRQAANADTFLHALATAGLSPAASEALLARLIDDRLLVSEDRGGIRRLELTHDTLTSVVRRSRDLRRQREEAEQRRRKRAWWLRFAALAGLILALICVPLTFWALRERDSAENAEKQHRRQLEHTRLEQANNWLHRAKLAATETNQHKARHLAGRAIGFRGFGRDEADVAAPISAVPLLAGGAFEWLQTQAKAIAQQANKLISDNHRYALLWSSPTGQHADFVTCIAYNHMGTKLASASADHSVKLWDASNGTQVATLSGHLAPVNSVAFSPDDAWLVSASDDRTVTIWDTKTHEVRNVLTDHTHQVRDLAYNREGSLLASASAEGSIILWDTRSWSVVVNFDASSEARSEIDRVSSICFTPDGRSIAVALGSIVLHLDIATSSYRTRLEHEHTVTDIAVDPNGSYMATADTHGTAIVWDAASGAALHTFGLDSRNRLVALAFSANGKMLTSCSDFGHIRSWDTDTWVESISKQIAADSHNTALRSTCLAIHPDGSQIALGSTGHIHVINGHELDHAGLKRHSRAVRSTAFIAGTHILTSSSFNQLLLWDLQDGEQLGSVGIGSFSSICQSRNGRHAALGRVSGDVDLIDIAPDEALDYRLPKAHKGPVTHLALSHDNRVLASVSEESGIMVWDLPRQALQAEIHPPNKQNEHLSAVALTPDGGLIAGGFSDGTIILWDTASGSVSQEFSKTTDPIRGLTFNEGAKLLASVSGQQAWIWALPSLTSARFLTSTNQVLTCVDFSPNGEHLVAGTSDGDINLWSIGDGQLAARLSAHATEVTSVAFNTDGSKLASGSVDRTVKLWDIAPSRHLLETDISVIYPNRLHFSSDGHCISVGNQLPIPGHSVDQYYDTNSGRPLHAFRYPSHGINSSNGHALYATAPTWSHFISIYSEDRATMRASANITLETIDHLWPISLAGDIEHIAWDSRGSKVALAFEDGLIGTWDITTGRHLSSVRDPTPQADPRRLDPFSLPGSLCVQFGNHGRLLAAAREGATTINLWDAVSGVHSATLAAQSGEIWCIAFNPDDSIIAGGSSDGSVRLWCTRSNVERLRINMSRSPVRALAFCPTGTRLAIGHIGGLVELHDIVDGRRVYSLRAPGYVHSNAVAFSPDGRKLACASSNPVGSRNPSTLTVWDVEYSPTTLFRSYTEGPLVTSPDRNLATRTSESLLKERAFPMLHHRNDLLATLARDDAAATPEDRLTGLLCIAAREWRWARLHWLSAEKERPIAAHSPSRAHYASILLVNACDALQKLDRGMADLAAMVAELDRIITRESAQTVIAGLPLHRFAGKLREMRDNSELTNIVRPLMAKARLWFPESPEFKF